jgi:hypothetical protein
MAHADGILQISIGNPIRQGYLSFSVAPGYLASPGAQGRFEHRAPSGLRRRYYRGR